MQGAASSFGSALATGGAAGLVTGIVVAIAVWFLTRDIPCAESWGSVITPNTLLPQTFVATTATGCKTYGTFMAAPADTAFLILGTGAATIAGLIGSVWKALS